MKPTSRRSFRTVTSLLVIASVSAAAASSCSTADDNVPRSVSSGCTLNSDCNDPLSCVFGRCHESCAKTRDCPAQSGQICVKTSGTLGVCQPGGNLWAISASKLIELRAADLDAVSGDAGTLAPAIRINPPNQFTTALQELVIPGN